MTTLRMMLSKRLRAVLDLLFGHVFASSSQRHSHSTAPWSLTFRDGTDPRSGGLRAAHCRACPPPGGMP